MPAVAQMVVCREVDGHTDTLLVTDSTWEASPGFRSYTDSWQPLHFGVNDLTLVGKRRGGLPQW